MKINLVKKYENIYKGKKKSHSPRSVILVSPVVVIFRTFVPDRDFVTHPMLFTGVLLVYNS